MEDTKLTQSTESNKPGKYVVTETESTGHAWVCTMSAVYIMADSLVFLW